MKLFAMPTFKIDIMDVVVFVEAADRRAIVLDEASSHHRADTTGLWFPSRQAAFLGSRMARLCYAPAY